MKRTILIALGSAILGIVIGGLIFGGHGGGGHDHAAMQAGSGAKKADVWTCSMHPQVQAPKPGKCPICAMDLIPQSAMGASAGGAREFSMSEVAKVLAEIETAEVVRQHPEARVHLYGKIDHDETRMRSLTARFPGRIDRLYVDYEGVRVSEGDELGVIYSPDLLTAQSELLTALRFGNRSGISVARDKLELWGFSRDRVRAIEESGKASDRLTIDSPLAGIVTRKLVTEGSYVKTGDMMFMIADHSVVWLVLEAYESDLPWLRFGQDLIFTTKAFGDREFEGQIVFIDHELDPKTRTAKVRVNVDNPNQILKPGMFAHAVVKARISGAGVMIDPKLADKWISPMHPQIVKDGPGKCDVCGMDLVPAEELGYIAADETETQPPLLIPTGAVLHTGKRSVVYVEKPNTEQPTYEGREILLGPRAGDSYIVEAGLREDEKVVSQGGFVIDSALQIQAKTSMMLPGEEPTPLFAKVQAPKAFLMAADEVLIGYFAIQNALAKDLHGEPNRAAATTLEKLKALPVDQLPDGSKRIWNDLAARLEPELTAIAESKDVAATRKRFYELTKVTDEWVRRFGTAHLPVYDASCSMAFEDPKNAEANWLQSGEHLMNPYMGLRMQQCGTLEAQIVEAKPISLAPKANAALESILTAYFALKDQLVAGKDEESRSAAAKLVAAIDAFDPASLENEGVSAQWRELAGRLKETANEAAADKNLVAVRQAFDPLSQAQEAMVTRFGGNLSIPVFEAHCPMAFENMGADWLQRDEDIRNPYFGDKMLRCGEIKRQIASPNSQPKED